MPTYNGGSNHKPALPADSPRHMLNTLDKVLVGTYKAQGSKWSVWKARQPETGRLIFLHENRDGSKAQVFLRKSSFPLL